ncbi:MAG: DUF6089 family protein [Bacteroidota bacterium]
MYRKLLLFALLTLGATTVTQSQVASQYPWEFGIQVGASTLGGDLKTSEILSLNQPSFSAGLMLRRRLGGLFALRLHVMYGGLEADDAESDDANRVARGFSTSTSVIEPGLVLEFEPLAQRRFRDGEFKRILSPFIYGGAAYSIWEEPDTDYNGRNTTAVMNDRMNASETNELSLPYGFGIKYYISPRSSLALDFGARFLSSDLLDGVSESGNPDRDDTYGFFGLRFATGFGIKDSDKDGIPDETDACPEEAGPESTNGCPDSDGDGLADRDDDCPDEAGEIALNGCPDSDGDGVADKDDACPDEAGVVALMGCPDSDGDGIADKDDECPDEAGIASLMGCPDSDGDGIADKDDDCPNEAGIASLMGCPDSDGDGIADKDDECPDEAGIAARNGCPEPEEVFENITDRIDRYRRLIDGFEYITLDESTGVIQIQNVYFATDRSNRDQLDRAILDEVAELLQREGAEDISIRFEGHADRRASEEYNQRLSERRAEGAMQYVIDKGVDASRVSMIGFGELQPVGDVDDLQANRVSISVVNEPPRRIE